MGINGLASAIDKFASAREKENAQGQPRALHGFLKDLIAPLALRTKFPRLLIDAPALLYAALHEHLLSPDQVTLPSYDWIDQWVGQLHAAFQAEHVIPVWYFDSSSATTDKLATHLDRMRQTIGERLLPMLDHLQCRRDAPVARHFLKPAMASSQLYSSLERVGAQTRKCVGEADHAMMRDFDPGLDLALISEDSDFFCSGARYIPISKMAGLLSPNTRHRITATLYTPEYVCWLLQLQSTAQLADFSTLAGNDYSSPILAANPGLHAQLLQRPPQTGRWLWQDRIPTISAWVSKQPVPLHTNLVALAARGGVPGAAALLEAHESLLRAGAPAEPPGPAGGLAYETWCDMVKRQVVPGFVLGLLYTRTLSAGVQYEIVDSDHLAAAETLHLPLVAAQCLLLGCREPLRLMHRVGVNVTEAVFAPCLVQPTMPVPAASTIQTLTALPLPARQQLMLYPLCRIAGGSIPADLAARLALPHAALAYYVLASAQMHRALPIAVVASLLVSSLPDMPAPPVHHIEYPNPVLVSVLSVFSQLISDFNTLSHLLQLPRLDEPRRVIRGPLFYNLALMLLACPHVFSLASAVDMALTSMQPTTTITTALRALADEAVSNFSQLCGNQHCLTSVTASTWAQWHLYSAVTPLAAPPAPPPQSTAAPRRAVSVGTPAVAPTATNLAASTAQATPIALTAALAGLQIDSAQPTAAAAPPPKTQVPSKTQAPHPSRLPAPQHVMSHVTVAPAKSSSRSTAPPAATASLQPPTQPPGLGPFAAPTSVGVAARASAAPPQAPKADLPIEKYRAAIIAHIQAWPITVVQADTGAGKSSRVPQMILASPRVRRRPFVIVTQPRRMAATSLAQRVAQELGEKMGQRVGFRIGNEREFSDHTELTFVTSGWLLQKLIVSPEYLGRITHLVLDEIHERSLDADLLCVVVKRLLQQYGDGAPRLILMSATFNASSFAQYFSPNPPEPIYVGNRVYPVSIFYTHSHNRSKTILSAPALQEAAQMLPCPFTFASLEYMKKNESKATVSNEQVTLLVWLCCALALHHRSAGRGTVALVFLPGMHEIEECYEQLQDANWAKMLRQRDPDFVPPNMELLMLHSLVDDNSQDLVFSEPATGVTRVILATNIAESSVTLSNVEYIIDFGLKKEIKWEDRHGCDTLYPTAISQASATQRAGRCGRVCPGTVLRLYSEDHFQGMDPYDTPELLRVSLASVLLRMKLQSGSAAPTSPFAAPRQLLADCIDSPPLENIQAAFSMLLDIGALAVAGDSDSDSVSDSGSGTDSDGDGSVPRRRAAAVSAETAFDKALRQADITSMGRLLACLPLGLAQGKAIVLAARLGPRYVCHAVVGACAVSDRQPFVCPNPYLEEYASVMLRTTRSRLVADQDELCDIVAIIRLLKAHLLTQSQRHGHRGHDMFALDGVLPKRMKSLLRSIREVAGRASPLLPQCRAELDMLSTATAGRGADPDELGKTLDRLLPLDEVYSAALQTLMLSAFWGSLCSVQVRDRPALRQALLSAESAGRTQCVTAALPMPVFERLSTLVEQARARPPGAAAPSLETGLDPFVDELVEITLVQSLGAKVARKGGEEPAHAPIPMVQARLRFKPDYGHTQPARFRPTVGELSYLRCTGRGMVVQNPRPPVPGLSPAQQLPTQFKITAATQAHPCEPSPVKITLMRGGHNKVVVDQSLVPGLVPYRCVAADLAGCAAPGGSLYGLAPALTAAGENFRSEWFSLLPYGSPSADIRTSLMLVMAAPPRAVALQEAGFTVALLVDGEEQGSVRIPLPAALPTTALVAAQQLQQMLQEDTGTDAWPGVAADNDMHHLLQYGQPSPNSAVATYLATLGADWGQRSRQDRAPQPPAGAGPAGAKAKKDKKGKKGKKPAAAPGTKSDRQAAREEKRLARKAAKAAKAKAPKKAPGPGKKKQK